MDVPAGEALAAVSEIRNTAFQRGTGSKGGGEVGIGPKRTNPGVFADLVAGDVLPTAPPLKVAVPVRSAILLIPVSTLIVGSPPALYVVLAPPTMYS